jgi:thiamine pyrophosphokinase
MRAIIVADGERPTRAALDAAWPGWATDAGLVVAADGGAATARALGLPIDVLVGDADSIAHGDVELLAASGAAVEVAAVDKDETDTELAILAAVRRGATAVTVLGALGGPRLDHALANLELLVHPGLGGRPIELLDDRSRVRALRAPGLGGAPATLDLGGPVGDLVSLIPLADGVTGVTTAGLRYPLADEALPLGPARGISNVRVSPDARVTIRTGIVLVVETTGSPPLRHDTGEDR